MRVCACVRVYIYRVLFGLSSFMTAYLKNAVAFGKPVFLFQQFFFCKFVCTSVLV